MSDTPETDASRGYALSSHYGRIEGSYLQMDRSGPFVHAEFARKLERQRDEARARLHPDRALEWLRVHYQSWFGDRTEWSDDIADRFYKDTATLTLFCQNFKFSKEAAK
jgi:hypothetical protein